jgi:hypothetical protein
MIKKTSKRNKIENEIIPLLDELCTHKIIPRYGKPIDDGFTINHAYKLLESKNIHYSRKTVERMLDALVNAGILESFIAGKEKAYVKAKPSTS